MITIGLFIPLAANFFAILAVLGVILVLALLIGYFVQSFNKGIEEDQRIISDKDLLLLFEDEPDGILTKERMVEKTDLTKSKATRRLQHLQYNGLLKVGYSNSFKYYYSLSSPIDHREAPELSNEPFLTVEDILKLFRHFDYKLTLQNMCTATGLPIKIIKRELKYFVKEKIISEINYTDPSGMNSRKTYTLREPYRSNPDQFLEMENLINPQLEKIYEKLFV